MLLTIILFLIILQEAIFRTLAGILHIGNIEFSLGKEHDSSIIKDATSNFHLRMAAELFMQVFYIYPLKHITHFIDVSMYILYICMYLYIICRHVYACPHIRRNMYYHHQ